MERKEDIMFHYKKKKKLNKNSGNTNFDFISSELR